MSEETYREALVAAFEEFQGLQERRKELELEIEEIDRKMLKLRRTLEALDQVLRPDTTYSPQINGLKEMGLTDAVRAVLKNSRSEMTAGNVRDFLVRAEYPLNAERPISAIHTVLTRLYKNGEAERDKDDRDGKVFRWKAPSIKPPPKPPRQLGDLAKRVEENRKK